VDHTIVHFEIPVDEPQRAIAFYTELFGWEFRPWGEPEPTYWLIQTVPPDASGMPSRSGVNGGMMKKHHPQQPWANYISVEDVDTYAVKAVSLGGQIALPKTAVPGMGWFVYLKDTEGNIFGIWQTDSNAAPV
jgi:predicted enzyme related to lactoylglutathione lyase